MRLDLRTRVNVGLAAVLIIFLTLSVRGIISIRQLVLTANDITRTLDVRSTVRATLAQLAEVESAERGYLLTGDTAYLAPVRRGLDAAQGSAEQLRRTTRGRAHQRYVRIAPLLRRRIAVLDSMAQPANRPAARLVAALPRDEAVMDSLRTWLAGMDYDELATLSARQDQSQDSARRVMSLLITGSLMAVLVALVLARLFHRDLTQRLQAEALYRSVVDVLAEGVVVQYASGKVVDSNHAAERILGLSRAEILQLNERDWAGRHEDGSAFPKEDNPGYRALRSGEPVRNQVMGVQRPDGAVRWLLINSMPLLAGGGRPVGAVTSFSDISRRREAEIALRESEARMRDFLENASDMIVTTDAWGRILYANRAWRDTLGYPAVHEYTGRPLIDFMDRSSAPGARAALKRIRRGEVVRDMDAVFVTSDGREVIISGSCAPRLEDGRVVATQSIFRDVTELSVAQEQLIQAIEHAERANQSKSAFLANMSHELRTPLNSVIGFAGVLMRNRGGHLDAQDMQYLSRIHDNGRHLLGLINSILDLSKVESGRMDVEFGALDLGALVRDTLAQMEPHIQGRPVELRAVVPEPLRPLVTDAVKLKQILINLVANALKFTEQGSVTVRIRVDEQGQACAIDVTDTGPGIAPERQAAVFEAFQQADNTTARRYGGTGLGLTITRSLAQLLGYQVRLHSQLGLGSTFTVQMTGEQAAADSGAAPREEAGAAAAARGDAERELVIGAQATPSRSRDAVLIIDDDPDARLLLAQYVKDHGRRALVASGGEHGLRLARSERPGLILLDLMMPQMTGMEVLEALREDPELCHIPVVIVSIVATEQRQRTVGAAALIDKPARREEIESVLTRFLSEPPFDKHELLEELIDGVAPARIG